MTGIAEGLPPLLVRPLKIYSWINTKTQTVLPRSQSKICCLPCLSKIMEVTDLHAGNHLGQLSA